MLKEASSVELEPIRSSWLGKFIVNQVAHQETLNLQLYRSTEQISALLSTTDTLNTRIAEMVATEAAMTSTENLLNNRVADLERTLNKVEQLADSRRTELNEVYASTSWRLSRPLRFCSLAMKQLPQQKHRIWSYLRSLLRFDPSFSSVALADSTENLRMELSADQSSIFRDLKRADERHR
jgi:DNA polymerase III psi subunit